MKSEKRTPSITDSYLYNVLEQGEKPFLYRNRICLLLGILDCERGSGVFSKPFVPVGFRYLNQAFMAQSGEFMPAPGDTLDSHSTRRVTARDDQWWELENIKYNPLSSVILRNHPIRLICLIRSICPIFPNCLTHTVNRICGTGGVGIPPRKTIIYPAR
jgi:hypothetical protein